MLRKEPWSEVGLALKHQGKVMVKTMKKDGTSSMGLKKYSVLCQELLLLYIHGRPKSENNELE